MFFNKFIIVIFLFLLSFSILGMDFSDGGGMNFGDEEEVQAPKKKKKSHKKKATKKKEAKKSTEEDSEMSFGEDDDSSMNLGEEDTKKEVKEEESAGMNFGDEDAGMVFGDEETQEEGKIDQKEMNFNLTEIDKDTDKKPKKEDKVKITKKKKSYVVKGVFFKLASGTTYMLAPKLSDKTEPDKKSLFGLNTHISVGYDISTALSLELYGEFIFNQAQIKGASNILYSRDFNSRTLGLGVNFNVLNKERVNLHINLHGGLLMIDPSLEIDGIKISAGGLIGFEYYLLLKHFSTSIFVSSDYMTGYDTISVSLSASLKYSF